MAFPRIYDWAGPGEQDDPRFDPDAPLLGRLLSSVLRQFAERLRELSAFINGKLSLGSWVDGAAAGALDAQTRRIYFKDSNVDVIVHHGLGRIPVNVFPGLPNKSTTFYTASRDLWTEDYLYLRSSTADVTVDLLVF